jgi:hypothetical protein
MISRLAVQHRRVGRVERDGSGSLCSESLQKTPGARLDRPSNSIAWVYPGAHISGQAYGQPVRLHRLDDMQPRQLVISAGQVFNVSRGPQAADDCLPTHLCSAASTWAVQTPGWRSGDLLWMSWHADISCNGVTVCNANRRPSYG